MSKKNKNNRVTEAVQEETVLSDEIGDTDTEKAEDNMEENTEEIITEEITEDIPAEPESAESVEHAAEEVAAAAEEEVPAIEEPAVAAESTPAAAVDSGTVVVITKPVNFRTGPSFGKASITELKVVSGSVEGDKGTWYECEFDGRKGYVKATGVTIKK